MTRLQEDYLNMSQTTIAFLQEDAAVWIANAAIAALVKDIDSLNTGIVDLLAEQEKDSGGVTKGKQSDRDGVEDDTHTISNILSFYATMTNNNAVQGLVQGSITNLGKPSGLRLLGMAQVVLQAGTDNLAAATPYGLTQDMLDSLSAHITAFTASINAPRLAITGTANATDMIEQNLHTLHTDIEDKLDAAMVLYKSNTAFYNQYKIVRIIVHSPTRHIAATAHFADGSGNAVADAKITIISSGKEGNVKVLRKSSSLGNIRVQNLVAGDYVLMVEKPGFTTQEITFTVAPSITKKLEVVMKGVV